MITPNSSILLFILDAIDTKYLLNSWAIARRSFMRTLLITNDVFMVLLALPRSWLITSHVFCDHWCYLIFFVIKTFLS